MLEFNRQLPVQGAALTGDAPVREGNPLRNGEQLAEPALAGFVLAQGELLELEAQLAETVEPLPEAPLPELPQEVAEQWLLGMLGQQALQLEAREPQAELPVHLSATEQPEPLPELLRSLPLGSGQIDPELPVAGEPESTPRPVLQQAAVEARPAQPLAVAIPAALGAASIPVSVDSVPGALSESLPGLAVSAPAPQQLAAPVVQRPAMPAAEVRLGEQMLQALRDSVEVQVRQGVQQASIRLDPPELGSMEIFVSHDSGRLNVQISAGNLEVARLLQLTSERLRQELVGSNFLQVNVQVGSEGQSGRQQGRPLAPWQEPEVLAAQRPGESAADAQAASDVLITV